VDLGDSTNSTANFSDDEDHSLDLLELGGEYEEEIDRTEEDSSSSSSSDGEEDSLVSLEPKSFREIYEEVKSQTRHVSSGMTQHQQQEEYRPSRYLERDKTRPDLGLYDSMLSLTTVIEVQADRLDSLEISEDETTALDNLVSDDLSSTISDSLNSHTVHDKSKSNDVASPLYSEAGGQESQRACPARNVIRGKENAGVQQKLVAAYEERSVSVLTDRDQNLRQEKYSPRPSVTSDKESESYEIESQVKKKIR
jgi:hypothetical protein